MCVAFLAVWLMGAGPSDSLFFTDEEIAKIQADFYSPDKNINHNQESVSLGAILYYGPGSWAVWLQGEKWTPATKRPHMKIISVSPDHVRLVATSQDNAEKKEITLSPYQTYSFSKGKDDPPPLTASGK